MVETMGRKKKPVEKKRTDEVETANQPFALRLREDVAAVMAQFRADVADKTGWEPPGKSEIIDRALRAFFSSQGYPMSARPGADDD